MQYRIKYVSCGVTLDTRKQFPAAKRVLWDAVRDMCAGHGLLDRPIAHKLCRISDKLTRDVHSATIALDDYASVTIERIGG